jgi:hypothetical protein
MELTSHSDSPPLRPGKPLDGQYSWGCYLYSRWLLVNIDGPFSKYGRTIDLPLI